MRFRGRIKRGKLKKRKGQTVTSPIIRGERIPPIVLEAPEHFSLVNNKDETLAFFDKALSRIQNCKVRQSIFFDLQKITTITPDAIMYLIAMVKNIKRCRALQTSCQGNMPIDPNARACIEKSGFYSFVSSPNPIPHLELKSAVQISSGSKVDESLIGSICSFVSAKSGLPERLYTKGLYQIIIELMTNTIQHAYNNTNGIMDNRWYIYAEDSDENIQFVFLDTGDGIPATITINFFEKVAKLFGGNVTDAKLISSALKGVYRSETGERHRGKGLPNIYDASKTDRISNLNIISGHGQCTVDESCTILESSSTINFAGTLFCWQFDKTVEE